MSRAARSDSVAQRAVAERLSGRVRRLARLLCGNAAEADDAAQSAMLEILRSASGFRVDSSLEHWAERITVRVISRARLRERRRRGLLERWSLPGTLPWGTPDRTRGREAGGIEDYLVRLNPERREALVMRHALEYTTEEIASLTGAPLGTVKDRLVAARKQLRRLLERDARRTAREERHGK